MGVATHGWDRGRAMTFGRAFRITGHLWGESTSGFPSQRPVTQSVCVFVDLRLNKRLSKQWWGWWFETPSRPLCRHCNDMLKKSRVAYDLRRHAYTVTVIRLAHRGINEVAGIFKRIFFFLYIYFNSNIMEIFSHFSNSPSIIFGWSNGLSPNTQTLSTGPIITRLLDIHMRH